MLTEVEKPILIWVGPIGKSHVQDGEREPGSSDHSLPFLLTVGTMQPAASRSCFLDLPATNREQNKQINQWPLSFLS